MNVEYFHQGQLRRVISHIIRVFGGFSVQTGTTDQGEPILRRIPCRWLDMSRQVGSIINENSENMAASAPFMTVGIERHTISRKDIRSQTSQKLSFSTNKQDENGVYTNEKDKTFSVERFNPVPWELEFRLDIWTTNTKDKTEILEQLACFFNPDVELQLSTNPLDWTATTRIELVSVDWTSRNVPDVDSTGMDIATMHFKTVMWYSLPALVHHNKLVHQVNINLQAKNNIDPMDIGIEDLGTVVVSPGDYRISTEQISKYEYDITLLYSDNSEERGGNKLSWKDTFDLYGKYVKDQSFIALNKDIEDDSPIKGWIHFEDSLPENKVRLNIDPDSMPTTTINPVNGIIDPVQHNPKTVLPTPVEGVRYIVMNDVDLGGFQWNDDGNTLNASNNDIIEFSSGKWIISNNPVENDIVEVIVDNSLYIYDEQNGWYSVILSSYRNGLWRIYLGEF